MRFSTGNEGVYGDTVEPFTSFNDRRIERELAGIQGPTAGIDPFERPPTRFSTVLADHRP